MKTGDPKYDVIDNLICNAKTKIPIPTDEPIFILRGKDIHAIKALLFYRSQLLLPEMKNAVELRVDEFDRFRELHERRMNEPD